MSARLKYLVVLIFLVLVGSGVFFWFKARASKKANYEAANVAPAAAIGPAITVDGFTFCLPPSDTNTSADCVIGIQSKNGSYYGLVDQNMAPLDSTQFTTGSSRQITGFLAADPDLQSRFKIVGTIQVR